MARIRADNFTITLVDDAANLNCPDLTDADSSGAPDGDAPTPDLGHRYDYLNASRATP
jgi:hypothetical protein